MLHRNEKIVPKSSQRKMSKGCVFLPECYFKENCLMQIFPCVEVQKKYHRNDGWAKIETLK